MEKWRFLDQNHGLTPLIKRPIFWLFEHLSFYSVKRRFFVLEYRKRHFPSLYCLKKNGKMAISGPKPWVNPFGKMSVFSTFWTSFFYSLERRVFVLEYRKRYFPGLHCLKKKVGKMPIFGPKPRVNPFGKMLIFLISQRLIFIA